MHAPCDHPEVAIAIKNNIGSDHACTIGVATSLKTSTDYIQTFG